MKINSNTFLLEKDSNEYKDVENLLLHIASETKITNVKTAILTVNSDNCSILFKRAEDEQKVNLIDKEMPLAQLQQQYKFVATKPSLEDCEISVDEVSIGDTVYAWADESGKNVDKIKVI